MMFKDPINNNLTALLAGLMLLLFLHVETAKAGDLNYGPYHAEVVRVLDGDTVDVKVDVWPQFTINTRIRVHGIDTPEKRTRRLCEKEQGLAATAWANGWFAMNPKVIVANIEFGKYSGRVLADVISLDGEDYGKTIIEAGHAAPYFGAAKRDWCLGLEDQE